MRIGHGLSDIAGERHAWRLDEAFALKCIAWGVRPEAAIDRVAELVHLRDLLRALQINCVIDVGANRGQFASELRGLRFAGRIVSFEPVAREFTVLSERSPATRTGRDIVSPWAASPCARPSTSDD